MATGTLSPSPKFYVWDTTTGDPLAGGLIYTVSAGGSYPADAITTYTDQALTVANSNPIILNSAGYCVIYLTPGLTYKYIVNAAANPAPAVPDDIIWTQDGIPGTPVGSPAVDVTGTAGENLAAEDAVYLSDGSAGKVSGSWYKADADNDYASSTAGQVGLALAAIASGDTGSIRTIGQMDYASALSPGAKYYASATAGALTATAPANQRYVGQADSTSSIILGWGPIPVLTHALPVPGGRMTLTTGVPVTETDVLAATSMRYTPDRSNQLPLWSGTAWAAYAFSELSLALGTDTADTVWDLFAYLNSGVITLERLAWRNNGMAITGATNATPIVITASAHGLSNGDEVYIGQVQGNTAANGTWIVANKAANTFELAGSVGNAGYTAATGFLNARATRIVADTLAGVAVKNGDPTRLFLGTYKTTGVAGQCEDSDLKRFVSNAYGAVPRPMSVQEVTGTWTYTLATWRQVRATASNQVAFVSCLRGRLLTVEVQAFATSTGGGIPVASAAGLDSTTTPLTTMIVGNALLTTGQANPGLSATGSAIVTPGAHTVPWLEVSGAFNTTTWYGLATSLPTAGVARANPGLRAVIHG